MNDVRYETYEAIIVALNCRDYDLKYASKELKNNTNVALISVSKNGRALKHVGESIKTNPRIISTALSQDGLGLEFCSDELKNDKSIVRLAVSECGLALEFASDELKGDQSIVFEAVNQNGLALASAKENLRDNFNLVMTAVLSDGWALEYASQALKRNKSIVLAAVSNYGLALEFACDALKNDFDVVMRAVSKFGLAICYASQTLKNNKFILCKAINQVSHDALASSSKPFYKKVLSQLLDQLQAQTILPKKKLMGGVGMLIKHIQKNAYGLSELHDSTMDIYEDYFSHILSFISIRDIGVFSQLSTNHYVEEIIDGRLICRPPKLENKRWDEQRKIYIASITSNDRMLGIKSYVTSKDCSKILNLNK